MISDVNAVHLLLKERERFYYLKVKNIPHALFTATLIFD